MREAPETGEPAIAVRLAVAGSDSDAAIEALAGMYAGKDWASGRTDDRYRFRYGAAGDDDLTIRRSQMRGRLRGSVATEDEFVVQWLDAGAATIDVEGDAIRLEHGVPQLFPTDRRFALESRDWDQRLVHLRKGLVLGVVADRYSFVGPVRFDHRPRPAAAAVTRWRRTVARASDAMRNAGTSSLLWHEAAIETARAFLTLYPPIGTEIRERPIDLDAHRVRLVIDYMEAHAEQPLTIAALAHVAEVSVRTLQSSFRTVLGRTPLEHLRGVRLRRVHDDLSAAGHGSATVSEIARRWGFAHMGRTAGAYLAAFGESPSSTLRRHA